MADYRDWCGYCHEEINFGGHSPDCDYMHAQRIAEKEQREFESALYKEYNKKPVEEIVDEAIELHNEMRALTNRLNGLDKKWQFLRYELMDKNALDQFRERTGKRYF